MLLRLALPVVCLALVPALAPAQERPAGGAGAQADGKPLFDARDGDGRTARPGARTVRERRALARDLGPLGVIDVDPETGTPRVITSLDGALTGPSEDPPATAALDYVRDNAAAFGLTEADLDSLRLRDRYTTEDGLTILRWTQVTAGIPAFDSGLKIALDRAGRVLTVSGSPAHGLDVPSTNPEITAASALAAVRRNVGDPGAARIADGPDGARRTTEFADGATAKLVVFATAGADELAWDVVTDADDAMYHAVVDASSGRVLYRANLTKSVSASVFENYPGAPHGGTATPTVFPDSWLTSATTLTGPNARTYSDLDDNNVAAPAEEVVPGNYPFAHAADQAAPCTANAICSWDSSVASSWEANREQNATQVFYFVNRFHDHLKADPIGFDEASGNFETTDPVIAHSNDGAAKSGGTMPDADHINNANMSTPPDGSSPRMQMYLFSDEGAADPDFRDINGGDASAIVYHEYTHGLSNRLVVNTGGAGALDSAQSGAMGEAWSDWYAMDFLAREGYEIDTATAGEIDLGTYTDATPHQIRYQGLDCPVGEPACPAPNVTAGSGGFTYGDFGRIAGSAEVHADGEIWAQTLWDLRTALIAQQGSETAGSAVAEQLITDGMRLSPPEPSFLDMRNAILAASPAAADNDIQREALRHLIWEVFAHRGMGFFASTLSSSDTQPIEDFSVAPAPGGPTGAVTGTVFDAVTGLPRASAPVGFGGHATKPAFADYFAATTGTSGGYTIAGVPEGTYPQLIAAIDDGYDHAATSVTIDDVAPATKNLAVTRDWAATDGGGTVASPAGATAACSAISAIDHSQGVGWSEVNPDPTNVPNNGVSMVVRLPQAITVTSFAIDPGATCGDGASATLKNYRLETSPNGTTWTIAKNARTSGGFIPEHAGTMVPIAPTAGTTNVRYVRLTMYEPQNECATCSGKDWIDVSELAVYGAPPNQPPVAQLTALPSEVAPTEPVTLDASGSTDPDSAIKRYSWNFGDGTTAQTVGPTTTHAFADQGNFDVTVTVEDFRAPATATAQKTVSVTAHEIAAPVIASPAASTWNRSGTVTLSGTAPAGSDVEIFDGDVSQGTAQAAGDGAWTTQLAGVADGTHVYTANASTASGLSPRSAGVTVRVDTVAPAAPAVVAPAENVLTRSASVVMAGTAEAGSTVTLLEGQTSLGTTVAGGDGTWSRATTDLPDGTHALTALATDPAGNDSALASPRTVRIDTVAPETTVTREGSALAFALASTEADAVFECRLDPRGGQGAWEACASGVSFGALDPGTYTLRARAIDPAGNVDASPAVATFRVLTAAQAAVVRVSRREFPGGFTTVRAFSRIAGLTAAGARGIGSGRLALRAVRRAQPVLVLGCERACTIRTRLTFATASGRRLATLAGTQRIGAGRARAVRLRLTGPLVRALRGKPLRVTLALTGPRPTGGSRTQRLNLRA
jgi:extracellular elastinolytic metalloproteinase